MRGGIRHLLIARPDVGQDRSRLAGDGNLDLGVAKQFAEPVDGQFLRTGASDDVDVRGEGFFQSFARRQQRAAGNEADERARSHSGTGI